MNLVAYFTNPYDRVSLPATCKGCDACHVLKELSRFPDDPAYIEAQDKCSQCPYHNDMKFYQYNKRTPFSNFTEARKFRLALLTEEERTTYFHQASKCTLHIFVALHFLHPNAYGIVHDVTVASLSELVGATKKSVRTSLKFLQDLKFISMAKTGEERGYYDIKLMDYGTYFLPASKGGKGYLNLSQDLFIHLLQIKNVNALRMTLMALMALDIKSDLEESIYVDSYHSLQKILPEYCKRNIIKEVIQNTADIFKVTCGEIRASFRLNSLYDVRKKKQEWFDESKAAIIKCAVTVKETIVHILQEDTGQLSDDTYLNRLLCLGMEYQGHPAPEKIRLSTKDEDDLTALAMEYRLDVVLECYIRALYRPLSMPKDKRKDYIKNLGGYVRRSVQSILLKSSPDSEFYLA